MTLQEALQEFLLQKRLEGLQPKSIDSYRNSLGLFIRAVGDVQVSDLVFEQVADYILGLYNSSLSRATVSSYLRNLRIFFRWVSGRCGLAFDYTRIKVPKSPKKRVKIYSDDEILQIFSLVQTSESWITARNRAIVAFFLDSGLRQCEIVSMQRSDVYYVRRIVKVSGKGAKDRIIPLGMTTMALLLDYLRLCPYESSFVFLGRRGDPMTTNTIKQFMAKLQRRLPFSLSSHKLRHNFATNFCIDHLRKNGDTAVYDLSILMGHESMETTRRYDHTAREIVAAENSISHLDGISGIWRDGNGVQE